MIKAVIFDLDDTLVKTHVAKWKQHKTIAKNFFGQELSDEKLREHWGKPFDTLVSELHDFADTIENLRTVYTSNAHKFPKEIQEDSHEVIRTLLERGIKLAIVTATNKDYLLGDLKRLHIPLEQFFSLQSAEDTSFHKPDPRVFDPILKELEVMGIAKDEVVYVGDAIADFRAARDAGLGFIAITTGLNSAQEFQEEGAPKILSRIGELPNTLIEITS